ncbi:peptidase inhibitor [Leptospira fletcheri]|uniref:Peptidase inhibitor n=1 Tax=Leptospira fletcheri TaxID=2484981 RepID=A0A4R9GJA9_9LEPT|nr:Ig-like domain-containing alpha-2-macroglobulin family protein [Leptospira fletcheri]TGK13804.1 peptidase inhibitor [Leptospira fletcheri]
MKVLTIRWGPRVQFPARFVSFFYFLCFFLLFSGPVFSQSGRIAFTFSPQGEIKKVGQVLAIFREPIVALGDPKRKVSPFKIECPISGEERWITETDWAYEFPEPLPGGVVCKFTTQAIQSLAGNKLEPGKTFTFHTGGPGVRSSQPYQGGTIAEDQAFLLEFDTEPKLGDLNTKIYFSVEGLENRIPIRIVQGKEREELIKASGFYGSSKNAIVLAARQVFPSGKTVRIVIEKGFRSASGVAASSDWVIDYQVRPSFTAGFTCERTNAKSGCVPVSPIYATFSSAIRSAWRNQIFLKTSDGKTIPAKKSQPDEEREIYNVEFAPPLPASTELQLVLPKGITDDAGRPLGNSASFPLSFKTDDYPPLAKFAGDFGIIERFPEALLPVTVRNIEAPVPSKHLNPLEPSGAGELILEQWASLKDSGKEFLGSSTDGKKSTDQGSSSGKSVPAKSLVLGANQIRDLLYWLRRTSNAGADESVFRTDNGSVPTNKFRIPSASGEKRFEVVGIPLKRNGLHIVEIESAILGKALLPDQTPMFVRTAALVTNLSLHFKWGKENSLLWLTTLDKGQPVQDAEIFVYDCGGNQVWTGKTGNQGLVITDRIPANAGYCQNESRFNSGYFLVAKKGDDFTLLHSSWQDGIEPWRFKLLQNYSDGSFRYATIMDRTLFREGETVRMNHILRVASGSGFRYPEASELPKSALVVHNSTDQSYSINLNWSKTFSAESQFTIPKEAVLGEYSVYFLLPNGSRVFSGSFTSAQFRLPLLKAELQADSSQFVRPKELSVSGQVTYLSGGTASRLPVSLRSSIRHAGGMQFPSYPNLEFGNGKSESSLGRYEYSEEAEDTATSGKKQDVRTVQSQTDDHGFLSEKIPVGKNIDSVHSLDLELEWKDPNGEIQTVARNFKLLPSKYLVAIRAENWVAVKNQVKSKVYVLDSQGNPVSGKKVVVKGISARYVSHRKRLVGGFYSYKHRLERKEIGEVCSGSTNAQGLLDCQGSVTRVGELYLEAKVDEEDSYAHTSVWVVGEKDLWFGSTDGDRMDLIPERKKYEPGETAKFQVRMPFQTATALVTVEREGILTSFVQTLSGTNPSVEIPVLRNYGPNVFVSVLAIRGRVASPKPSALVDLAKPSYRLGMAEIQVGWKPFELELKVLSEREEYRPREKAKVKVILSEKDREKWKDTKITLAAVDESLLELKPNLSWNLLSTMMSARGIDVRTSTAQTFLVGRRHFGLKSLPVGGGGGKSSTRELFDTLVFWKADATPNSQGELEFEVPLNDSLTAFKIVAVASSGTDKFGSASTSVRTSQEVLSYAAVSPFVREGDKTRPGLSLKNSSSKTVQVQVSINTIPKSDLPAKTVSLGPNASNTVSWDMEIPKGVREISYEFSTVSSSFSDSLKVKQKVESAVPLTVLQANFYQLNPSVTVPLEEPKEAEPNRSKVELSFQSSMAAAPISGIEAYMERYPYTCLEQKVSKAVSLGEFDSWKETMRLLPKYMDSDGLLKFFPGSSGWGNVSLTSYVLILSSESGWEIPETSRQAMLGALHRFVDGTLSRPSQISSSDTLLRKIAALESISLFTAPEASRIRSLETDPNRLPTETLVSLRNLYRNVNWDFAKRNKLDQVLRSRLRVQGSSYELASDDPQLWWLLSSRDGVQIRLLSSVLKEEGWKADMPKLLRGILNQMKLGHFDITPANALGVLLLKKYRNLYESGSVAGKVKATLGSAEKSMDWKEKEGAISFSLPEGRSELKIDQEGGGSPYAYVKTSSALPLTSPIHSGLRVEKEVLDENGKPKNSFREGDVVRVRLKLKSEFSISWLAIRDPIPAGSTILGSGLGRDSAMLSQEVKSNRWDGPSFVERKFEGLVAYYEIFYPGESVYEYSYRINSPGTFRLPPTRVEAMYQPEIFSTVPNPNVSVVPLP